MDLIISQNGYSDYKRKVLEDDKQQEEEQVTVVKTMGIAFSL
jgi:hypothetical protein